MKTLAGVIRLHRWQLDEKRRALGELEALADRLGGEIRQLDADMAAERQAAEREAGNGVGFSFAAYVRNALARRERLQQSIRQVEEQIAAARDEIAEAFQELKKFELAQEDRDRRAANRRRRAETIAFDEIALTRFLRRQGQGGD